jgi:hypothetical protein
VAVYNLHDEHAGGVSIGLGKSSLPVALGHHLMIARDQMKNYEDVNPLSFVTHSDMSSEILPGGAKVFNSKFSIVSALTGLEPIATLRHSSNPRDRKLADRLFKNAAILMQLNPPSAPYKKMANEHEMLSMQN